MAFFLFIAPPFDFRKRACLVNEVRWVANVRSIAISNGKHIHKKNNVCEVEIYGLDIQLRTALQMLDGMSVS